MNKTLAMLMSLSIIALLSIGTLAQVESIIPGENVITETEVEIVGQTQGTVAETDGKIVGQASGVADAGVVDAFWLSVGQQTKFPEQNLMIKLVKVERPTKEGFTDWKNIYDYYKATIEVWPISPESSARLTMYLTMLEEEDLYGIGKIVLADVGIDKDGNDAAYFKIQFYKPDEKPSYDVKVELYPEKQDTETGLATYTVIIQDNHPAYPRKICDEEEPCPTSYKFIPEYKYALDFKPFTKKTTGSFDRNSVTLLDGEKTKVTLTVKTENKGSNYFSVSAKGEDSSSSVKGVLTYMADENDDDTEPQTPTTSFFNGDGFAIAYNEENGKLVSLHLLEKEKTINGKMTLDNKVFKVKGTLSGDELQFSLSDPNANFEEEGNFDGTVKIFDSFILVEGDLNLFGYTSPWKLTAFSKRQNIFKTPIILRPQEKTVVEEVEVEEVITLKETEESETSGSIEETFVTPVRISRERILWIFPTGKKVLEVEITEKDLVTRLKIKEHSSTEFGSYKIEVGSLEDSENIELSFTKE